MDKGTDRVIIHPPNPSEEQLKKFRKQWNDHVKKNLGDYIVPEIDDIDHVDLEKKDG